MKQPRDEQNDILRKYLLHDLTEPEREEIEVKLLTDQALSRRLAIARDDLFDSFVTQTLAEHEMERFRKHCLTSPAHLQKLKFATALDSYITEKTAVWAASPFKKLQPYLRARPLKTVFAVVGLVFVFGAALFFMTRLGWFQRDNFQVEFARLNRAQDVDSMPFSDLELSSANTQALILRQNLVREDVGPRRVEITAKVTLVRLLLEVPSGSQVSYKAVLQTAVGEDLVSTGDLKARKDNGAQFVVTTVPARFLTSADYQIRLIGISPDGRTTDVGLYPFQVITR
jgi:hypothetical protein